MSNESPKQFELEYSNYAQTNLKDIARNIYEFTYSVISASNTTAKIMYAIELLPYQPFMGIKGKITGTREIYSNGYRIIYRVLNNKVRIVTILHSSRLYPNFKRDNYF